MTKIHPMCKFTPRVYICTGVYIVHMNEALELIVKYNIGLKTLLQQGISEPIFYGGLVYQFKKDCKTLYKSWI